LQGASRFLRKAIGRHGEPKKITIDKSGANTAAIESYNEEREADIEIRRINLNNIVEQDHRAVKRVTRPTQGFRSFSIGCRDAFWDRADAHDAKGADTNNERNASRAAIRFPCRLSHVILTHPSRV
jgi:transposase-like protein